MKIAVITPYPPSADGIAAYSANLVTHLRGQLEVTDCLQIYSFKRHGVSDTHQIALISYNPIDWIRMYRSIVDLQPDIIHIQFDLSNFLALLLPIYLLLTFLKKKDQSQLVATYHESYRDKELYGIVSKLFYMQFSRLFQRIYVHTRVSETCLCTYYEVPRVKIRFIPHGTYDFAVRRPNHEELIKRYHISEEHVVLSFGYIYKTKGLEYLIEAIHMIREAGGTLPAVIIAGEVPRRHGAFRVFQKRNEKYFDRLKSEVADYGLDSTIRFVGYVDDDDVYSIFSLADIVVLPYVSVDQSGVLNIALAALTPTIASDIGGMGETLRESGVLVKPGDARAISVSIERLLGDEVFYADVVASYRRLGLQIDKESVSQRLMKDYYELAVMDQ